MSGWETRVVDGRVYVPLEYVEKLAAANHDSLIPEVIKTVSPSVVGVIGSLRDDSDQSARFKDPIK